MFSTVFDVLAIPFSTASSKLLSLFALISMTFATDIKISFPLKQQLLSVNYICEKALSKQGICLIRICELPKHLAFEGVHAVRGVIIEMGLMVRMEFEFIADITAVLV